MIHLGNDDVTGVNQILPHKNKWAWDLFLKGCKNNWMPTEISMQTDIKQWRQKDFLTDDEKTVIKRSLGFFAGSESLVSNNLLLQVFRWVNDGECRQYIARQSFEECYAEGTEVLTERGWVEFQNLKDSDTVAQFDNGNIEFVNFTNKVSYFVDGELMQFNDNHSNVDLLVTKNHRMVCLSRNKDRFFCESAETVNYKNNYFPVGGTLNRTGKSLSAYERFLIAFQADGSFVPGKYRNGNRNGGLRMVNFNLKKKRKQDRIIEICNACGFKYHISEPDNKGRRTYLVWVPFSYEISKTFDWVDLKKPGVEWCREFIEEVKHWDGWIHENGTLSGYDSTIKANVDIVQAIAILAGYKCHYGVHVDNRKESFSDLHRLTFQPKRQYVSRGCVEKSLTQYRGNVHCVTVPSGMLVVRRNGRVAISGNSLHNLTIVYICDSLSLDIKEVYEAYREIDSIKRKDDFLMNVTRTSGSSPADILRNIITYYIICEGILFFSGFTMLLSFGRQNKMPGVAEQIQYTYRDESNHIEFGVRLIDEIKKSYPEIWTDKFVDETREHIRIATELEIAYAHDVLPNGILGLNAGMFIDYMQFMANKRLESIGIPTLFAPQGNPFPWMTGTIELSKMKNFFETRVTEYAVGEIVDDF